MAKINYKPLANLVRNISAVSEVLSAANDTLFEVKSNLERMHQLALDVRYGQLDIYGIHFVKKEMDAILSEVTRITSNTKIHGDTLFNGAFSKQFQVGFNNNFMVVNFFKDITAIGLGIDKLDVMTQENTVEVIDYAIGIINAELVEIEKYQSGVSIIKNNISDIMSSECVKGCMEQMSYDIPESNYESLENALTEMSEVSKVLSVADMVLNGIDGTLGIIYFLVSEATSGAVGTTERDYLKEALHKSVEDIADAAGKLKLYGLVPLDDGAFATKDFQVGISKADTFSVGLIQDMSPTALLINDLDVSSTSNAAVSCMSVNSATYVVKTEISKIEDWQDMVYMGKNEIGAIGVCVEQCWE